VVTVSRRISQADERPTTRTAFAALAAALAGKADRALTILEEGCDDAFVVLR
jgi:hypothetical protein